jgi:hypothetical protein
MACMIAVENPQEELDSHLESDGGTIGRAPRPLIQAMQWLPARDVLPREADDFTPWLADNLDILAAAIGLQPVDRRRRALPRARVGRGCRRRGYGGARRADHPPGNCET